MNEINTVRAMLGMPFPEESFTVTEEHYYCPDCGNKSLRLIENTDANDIGEYKQVCTCDVCENMVYLYRNM